MLIRYSKNMLLTVFLLFCLHNNSFSYQNDFELVKFKSRDGLTIEASHYNYSDTKAVIFAHGGVFNKESWYFIAEKLADLEISSLPFDFRGYGNSEKGDRKNDKDDVLGAIDFLIRKEYKEIYLVGASMGGSAILQALDNFDAKEIKKVILLAPAGGPPVRSKEIDKLLIVAEDDRHFEGGKTVYDNSSQPKSIKIYKGSAHAQFLFESEHKDDVIKRILDFFVKK